MLIDNFSTIENFMLFEEGSFYKFEALVRNTDGISVFYPKEVANKYKTVLIKSWYVNSLEYYLRVKSEMIALCELTGARLYMTLDRKSEKKLLIEASSRLNKTVTDLLYSTNLPVLKRVSSSISSCSSSIEISEHDRRTIMFDIDANIPELACAIEEYILSKGQKPRRLTTKKGFHVFCYRGFNCNEWVSEITKRIPEVAVSDYVSLHENALGLVYYKS